MALTKIDDRGLKTPIDLLDNEKIRLGTGNDLDIFHDSGSTKSMINNQNGELRIVCDNAIRIGKRHDATIAYADNMIVANPDGSVELYYDNVKQLETVSTGTQFQNRINFTGTGQKIDLTDNQEIRIGTGDDLQIYHDGANSYLKNTTGDFRIDASGPLMLRSDDVRIYNAAGNELIFHGKGNGSTDLYYDNSKKFETTSVGVTLTGGGLSISNGWNTQWGANASRAFIQGEDANGNNRLLLGTNNTERVRINSAGDAMFGCTVSRPAEFAHPDGFAIRTDGVKGQFQSTVDANTCAILNRDSSDGNILSFRREGADVGHIGVTGTTTYLQFGGTNAAAHRLDDYEEGTYSPQGLAWSGSDWATVTFDSISRYGRYTKIGALVHVQGFLSAFHVNSSFDGQLAGITLPFAAVSASYYYSVGVTTHSNGFSSSGYTTFFVNPATSNMYSMQENTTSYNTWSGSSNRYIMFQVSYMCE